MDRYWVYYNSDCRLGAIMVSCLHLPFELKRIIYPMENTNQRNVNIVYLILTLICYAILVFSYKKEYGVKFSYYSVVLIILKTALPLLDFENAHQFMDHDFKY